MAKRGAGKRGRGKVGERIWRDVWSEKGRNRFRQKLGGVELGERGLEEEWVEMEGKLKGAMKETEEELNKEEKRKVGW